MRKLRFIVARCAALGLCLAQPLHAGAENAGIGNKPYADYLYVTAQPRDQADLRAIWSAAENVLEPHDPGPVTHHLAITRSTLTRLRALGIPLHVEAIDVQAFVDGLYESASS